MRHRNCLIPHQQKKKKNQIGDHASPHRASASAPRRADSTHTHTPSITEERAATASWAADLCGREMARTSASGGTRRHGTESCSRFKAVGRPTRAATVKIKAATSREQAATDPLKVPGVASRELTGSRRKGTCSSRRRIRRARREGRFNDSARSGIVACGLDQVTAEDSNSHTARRVG